MRNAPIGLRPPGGKTDFRNGRGTCPWHFVENITCVSKVHRAGSPAPTRVDFRGRLCWYGTMSFSRPKKKPLWRQAEDYFRRERDAKLPISLPALRVLQEKPLDEEQGPQEGPQEQLVEADVG